MTDKISEEVCEAEFLRFAEAMGLDVDQKGMDDEDKKSFLVAKNRILGAMRDGGLVIDAEGRVVFTPIVGTNKDPITFYEPTGAALIAMDQKKSGHDMAKGFAFLADMTKEPISRFVAMANRDLKVCQAVLGLFLG